MIRIDNVQAMLFERLPHQRKLMRLARWWCVDPLCALKSRSIQVLLSEVQIMRAGLPNHRHAARPRMRDLSNSFRATHVHEVNRGADNLGEGCSARAVASASTRGGRLVAWYLGSVLPSGISRFCIAGVAGLGVIHY